MTNFYKYQIILLLQSVADCCSVELFRAYTQFVFNGYCRVAEEVIFGDDNVTTGASNDFMQVSRVARQMVERFGFSKKIGQIAIGGPGGNPFLGQQVCSNTVTEFRGYLHILTD